MTDVIDADGLQVSTLSELITQLEDALKNIFGSDINLDSNSPDGQEVNIFSQGGVDLRELLVPINNSFDPDQTTGVLLDQRVVINNIQRKGGTFTIQEIDIVVDRTVTLQGLDADFNDINGTGYTVQDDAGTQFILIDSITLTAGSYSLNFRAQEIGEVTTILNTITNPVTIILGVISIDNSSAELQIGENQETDSELRLRRSQSVSLASEGYIDSILSALLNLDGVSEAKVFENFEDTTDSDGIPPHAIWVIVEGGANTDIANAIYVTRPVGINMKGDVMINIVTLSGQTFTAQFDRPESIDLFIELFFKNNDPSVNIGDIEDELKEYIVDNVIYDIGQTAEVSEIISVARDGLDILEVDAFVTDANVSDDDAMWVDFLDTPQRDQKWTLDTTRITINLVT